MLKLFRIFIFMLSTSCILSSCYNEDIKYLKSEIFELKNEVRKLEQLKYDIAAFSKAKSDEKIKRARMTDVNISSISKNKNTPKTKPSNLAITSKSFDFSINEIDDPFLGENTTNNVIMVFSNFQSKLSAKFFRENLDEIKREFIANNKFKLIFRDFPLSTHRQSINAANFANCAAEQNKYWDAFKVLFNNQALINSAKYETLSQMISGINVDEIMKCTEDLKYLSEIKLDKKDGKKLNIKGIPNIFIGRLENNKYSGSLIRGAQPLEIIKQYLRKYE